MAPFTPWMGFPSSHANRSPSPSRPQGNVTTHQDLPTAPTLPASNKSNKSKSGSLSGSDASVCQHTKTYQVPTAPTIPASNKSNKSKSGLLSGSGMTSAAQAPTVIDLNTLLEDYAWRQFKELQSLRGNEYKNLEREHVQFEIDTGRLHIVNDDPNYTDLHKVDAKPFSLFKAVFKNDTQRPQAYSFKTERTTESVCTVFKEQGYSFGVETELTLKTPCEILEAKAGFKHEMSFNKGSENSTAETLSWGVDSTIVVPANCRTTAELVVEELNYRGKFANLTYLSGTVIVSIIRRKDGALLMPMIANIVEVCVDTLAGNSKLSKELRTMAKITNDKRAVEMRTKGSCGFQFATEQRVQLHEETGQANVGTQTDPQTDGHGHAVQNNDGLAHSTGFLSKLSPYHRTDYNFGHYERR